MTITIHVVCHAHLDQVWLWPWSAGLDEAIATCRSACDRLDGHPELFFTQGEAWTFAMVERADPALFARIRTHIASGRWEVVNGWWSQPDCNFPSIDGLRAQLTTGQAYVRERFGVVPRCGFNPDSFGHCAILPEVLRSFAQDRYVFMRPQEHELTLPARVFRWRTQPGGKPVTTFRIAKTYQVGQDGKWLEELPKALEGLPDGLAHTMVLAGVGNHGGGPTERMVRWIKANRDVLPGARLEFSTVERFFNAVDSSGVALPEVIGELQHHAVGCYSVVRSVKTAVRRAEHAVARATIVATADEQAALVTAWQATCAHQFHDTLGGSCVPEAWRGVEDQLGGAAAVAEEALTYAVRRQVVALPDDDLPRLIFANPGAHAFSGWCDAVPYVEGPWRGVWRLFDPEGTEVPFQALHSGIGFELGAGIRRVLVHRSIAAGELAVLRLDHTTAPTPIAARVRISNGALVSDAGVTLACDGVGPRFIQGKAITPLAFHLLDDPSDTWSHGLDRYVDTAVAVAAWQPATVIDSGPLMVSLRQDGVIGTSRLSAEWRLYAGEAVVELLLTVLWCEHRRVLKLVLPARGAPTREDGSPGMPVTRANDGRERPLHDYTRCSGLGIVCPDAYAIDATLERLRLTLLRAPEMAHHDPTPTGFPRGVFTDQGEHRFRFRFHLGSATTAQLAAEALGWHRPPLVAETTRGMPARMIDIPRLLDQPATLG